MGSDGRVLTVYTDHKSPYAYLAKDLAYELEAETGVRLEWLPYVLDIPSYLGSATLDAAGRVIEEQRNAHQWRRVRYSYMDCRREARKRGLTIRGTQKIWDSSVAAIGMLYAKQRGNDLLRAFNDLTFARFWRRELNIEDPAVVAEVIAEAGGDAEGFRAYLAGEGRAALESVHEAAHTAGVFGVPTFVLEGEIFWGREHLPDIRALLRA